MSALSFVLVGVQGWLGSIVVSTNLLPGIITVHMMLALLIVCLLIWAVAKVAFPENMKIITGKRQLNIILAIAMVISLIQLVVGTQVRENIDLVANALGGGNREIWIEKLGTVFYVHRSFSWLVAGVHVYLWFMARKNAGKTHQVTTFATFLLLIIGVEFASGVGMAYFGMPAWLQPVHLLLASLTIGIQFAMLLWLNPTIFGINKKYISENQKIHS
ncbi:MAG: COX15/CtaA family protein [Verrucomicrobia bacterium]|nr:COX15/CtaA family protein [Cytophagales bacterium]